MAGSAARDAGPRSIVIMAAKKTALLAALVMLGVLGALMFLPAWLGEPDEFTGGGFEPASWGSRGSRPARSPEKRKRVRAALEKANRRHGEALRRLAG